MKKLIHEIERKIRSKKGETLIESLVSILILTLLSLAVAVAVQSALNITGDSLKRAQETQDKVNAVIHAASGTAGTITFEDSNGITAHHTVTIYNTDGITAFYPQT